MIMANLTPVLLLPDAPGWYRFLSSLAAPLFILLAGMMIALSRTGKGRRLSYIALRLAIGYNPDAVEIPTISFFGPTIISGSLPGFADIVRLWFIDGWFPVFPWLAVSLFGAELGMYRWGKGVVRSFLPAKEGLAALALLIAGGLRWVLSPEAVGDLSTVGVWHVSDKFVIVNFKSEVKAGNTKFFKFNATN